jgi:SAM-dependent methyltransferase
MTCRHCIDAADLFGDSMARHELKRYRRRGPSRTTRLLLEGLRRHELEGFELLDIGGGVGALQHELLESGARAAVAVDASPAYLAAAETEARRRGLEGRVTYRYGDAVELADDLPQVDVVTLDRVLCCYPDMPALVAASVGRTRNLYGLVFPRESWWVRIGVTAINLMEWARRKAFRVYLHGVSRIEDETARHGLETAYRRRTWLWEVRVFRRPSEASPSTLEG